MAYVNRDAVIVQHAPKETPFGAIVIAAIAKQLMRTDDTIINFEPNKTVSSGTFVLDKVKLQEPQLLRELCLRIASCKRMLYIDSTASLDKWMNYISDNSMSAKTEEELWQYYVKMNKHLATRTFLVGYRLTVVDVLQFTALSKAADVRKRIAEMPHVYRWYNYIMGIPGVQTTVNKPSKPNKVQVEKKPFTKHEQIENSYKGHTKAALLNHYFAKQYDGRLLLRFDDTNPLKEKIEYEETIKEDLTALGVNFSSTSYTSDYFDTMQQYAFKLIRDGALSKSKETYIAGLAYCDDTDVNTMRYQRNEGIESAARNLPVETNIANFEEMLKVVVHINCGKRQCRDHKRGLHAHHNRQGDKYKAFPTYDFACPIVDSLEGVTHALRSNEYSARIPQYNWFIEKCALRPVEIYEFSRLNFVKTVLSKRKLQWFVDNGIVNGWNDPRMPTVRGIMRKGLTIKALLEFILEQGPSKAVNLMEWDKLWAKNKQIIDPIVPRYAAVGTDAVELKLNNFENVELPPPKRSLHPKDPEMGECDIWFTPIVLLDRVDAEEITDGEEVTLMRWGNVIVSTPSFEGQLNPSGDFKKTKKKLHWLPKNSDKLIKCTLKQYGDLLAVDKIDPEQLAEPEDMRKFLEPITEWTTECLADKQLALLQRGRLLRYRHCFTYLKERSYSWNAADTISWTNLPAMVTW
ncbi:putative glutamate-tRNA ligase [Babesia sp. Xinjiang]|uniref:putative glutamate-tRNA ligase n=1 Tax=Babesia sp. Xinjiang TaxID=462227 RepID=UPI000A238D6C|nr:putative glutamate-tRNA ligase [Babesia sp. Xinjiang]ORM42319.1 putative glutamate-tRNA ligase [Babesia sp. Xinjiang]